MTQTRGRWAGVACAGVLAAGAATAQGALLVGGSRANFGVQRLAPGFVRPLIPTTWRRDIAGALTGAAVGASLKHDYATPIEVADRAFEAMTGASTTVVPLPSISFDLF